jgi:hypothetical protein
MEPLKSVTHGLVVLALACAPQPCVTAAPAPPPEPYVFVPDVSRLVGVYQGDWLLVGRLDAAGNFLKTERYKRGESPSVKWEVLNDTGGQPRRAYEYRSGMLIRGLLDKEGNFVPDEGSTVIPFRDYKYDSDGPKVWNLPGYFKKKSELTDKEKEAIKASGR